MIEKEFKSLPVFRRILLCLLSLLKIATILLHFYERHLLGWPPSVARLRESVPPGRLLDEVLFTILVWSGEIFRHGMETAAGLLDIFIETALYELPIPVNMGFHARPSTLVARVVQHHGAEVRMHVDDQIFDASNIMEMLSAGGYIVTKRLYKVIFRGDKTALDDLRILAEANYGETRDGKGTPLPEKLRYLEDEKTSKKKDEASG
jgi:phosphotransferase system HPr-like phosphotransfer protein